MEDSLASASNHMSRAWRHEALGNSAATVINACDGAHGIFTPINCPFKGARAFNDSAGVAKSFLD